MAYLSGKGGGVNVGGTDYAFEEWSLDIDVDLQLVKPFVTGANRGFQRVVPCFAGGDFTLSGAYDSGAMPLTAGNSYTIILRWSDALTITITGYVGKIKPEVKADGVERINVTGKTDASFTLAVT